MDRLQQLELLLKEKPNNAFLLFATGKEYEGLNDLDNALKYYLKLIDVSPDYVGVYYHLGKLYEILEEPQKALKTYEDGIKMAEKQGDAHAKSELLGAKSNL